MTPPFERHDRARHVGAVDGQVKVAVRPRPAADQGVHPATARHPGATARLIKVGQHQLVELALRHRRRARAEDRIRHLKDLGLANLPLHGYDQNRLWRAIVGLAGELTAWRQVLALPQHQARRWEPKELRLRPFTVPAILARTGRRVLPHLADHPPWAQLVADAATRLRALALPG